MKLFQKIKDAPYAAAAAITIAMMASSTQAHAEGDAKSISNLADNLQGQIKSVGQLLIAGGFLVGVGFVVAGLMKLKQAADTQGQQVKYGEGLWRLAVGAGLVAVPAVTTVLTGTAGFSAPTIEAEGGW